MKHTPTLYSPLLKWLVFIIACSLLLPRTEAQDIGLIIVTKGQAFEQHGPDTPTLNSERLPFFLGIFVEPQGPSNVLGATLTSPAGTNYDLEMEMFDDQFKLEQGFTTAAELDAIFGTGNYHLDIVTASNGTCGVTIPLPTPVYPNTPHISNWTAAQTIDASAAFTVRWDAFVGGTAQDFVQLRIEGDSGEEFSSGEPGEPGSLTGTATSFLLPADTLQPGIRYRGSLLFAKFLTVTPNICGDATGLSAFHKETEFDLATINPNGILEFSSAAYVVGESNGPATITVKRNGGTMGTVSVQYFTSPGSAQPPQDYSEASGTLTFGPGESSKTFTVAVNTDDVAETDETIYLTLNQPMGGATLGEGAFALLTILEEGVPSGPNVASYLVAKGQELVQAGPDAPVLVPAEGPYQFHASVDANFPGAVSSASVRPPSGTSYPLDFEDQNFSYDQQFVTKAALDAAFAAGSYTFTIGTLTDGTKTPVLTLGAEPTFAAPHIANWSAAQLIDANTEFSVMWDAFAGGTSNDFIHISIEDNNGSDVIESGWFLDEGRLNGTNLIFTIPANTLDAAQVYEARLLFVKRTALNTTAYPGVPGIAGYFKQTRFPLITTTTPPAEGRLQFSAFLYDVNEGNATAAITVLRTGGSEGTVTVDLVTANVTASDGLDYVGTNTTLTFTNGVTSQEILLPILDDFLLEANETAQLSLLQVTGGAELGTASNAVLRIIDNELTVAGVLQFALRTNVVTEGGPAALITVLRSGGSAGTVSVDFATLDVALAALEGDRATAELDYLPTNGTLVFGPGQLSKSFTVPILNDALDESAEVVPLLLSNPMGGASLGERASAVLVIVDNDMGGLISFSAPRYVRNETGEVAVITIKRTGGTAAGASVDFVTMDGTATNELDYAGVATNLVFASNQMTFTLEVPILDDALPEGNETVWLTLSNPDGGATLGATSNAVLTIEDNEVTLQFTRPIYTNSEAGPLAVVSVLRSGPLGVPVAVNIGTVEGGTATPGVDYVATNGTLNFPAGSLMKIFAIRLINDTLVEEHETVNLALSSPSNALLGPLSESVLLITNNDFGGVIAFSSTNFAVTEAGPAALIKIKRTGGAASGVTVDFSTEEDTATDGADYTGVTSGLTFAAGELMKTVAVPILNDNLAEGSEVFQVHLSNPSGGATLGLSNSMVTLADNDKAGMIAFSKADYATNENGGMATIVLTRMGGTASNVTIHFATADVSATEPDDYTAVDAIVTFNAGQLTQTVQVPINNDTNAEGNETVRLTLREPTGGAKLGAISNAVLRIIDDESSVSFTNISYQVSEAGPLIVLNVVRSGALNTTVMVDYMTMDESATAGSDYRGTNGTLTFPPGATFKAISIPISNDTLDETNETFTVILKNPQGGVQLGTLTNATVTILDNDAAGTLQFSSATYNVNESAGHATIVIKRTGGLAGGVSVHFQTSEGTATAGTDYTAISTNLTFGPGELMKSVLIPITADSLGETNETVLLSLSEPGGRVTLGPTNMATLTIVNTADPNAVPAAGAQFLRLTATGIEGNSFNRTFNVTPPTLLHSITAVPNPAGGLANVTASIVSVSGQETFQLAIFGPNAPGTIAVGSNGSGATYTRVAAVGAFGYVTSTAGASGNFIVDVFDPVAKKFTGRFDLIMVDDTDDNKRIHVVGSFRANLP